MDAAVAAKPAGGSGSDAKAPPPIEDKAVSAAFRAAMKKGRKATDAKDYAGAIAGFDEALEARPNDPHAIAERGFAKLLAGTDLTGASGDFDHAADLTHDPKLLSMIWFNRGLTDEKLGNSSAALTDYYLANQLLPSKSAAAKLAGKAVCQARVGVPAELSSDPPIDAADWLALAKAMDALDDLGDPTTSDDARKAMLGDDKPPTLPTTMVVGGYTGKTAYIVGKHGAGLRAIAVASRADAVRARSGSCFAAPRATSCTRARARTSAVRGRGCAATIITTARTTRATSNRAPRATRRRRRCAMWSSISRAANACSPPSNRRRSIRRPARRCSMTRAS